jgi:hypothetical protein
MALRFASLSKMSNGQEHDNYFLCTIEVIHGVALCKLVKDVKWARGRVAKHGIRRSVSL